MSTVPPRSSVPITEEADWRARLLASLRDCGVQRAPRDRVLQWIITIFVLVVFAVVTFIGRKVLDQNLRSSGDAPVRVGISILWSAFVIFVLVRIRNRFLRTAWKTSARSAEEELERAGSRRPILYLRSFQLDERIGRPTWMERFLGTNPWATPEQGLARALRKRGPAIAIGRPEEKLPELGAARFYVSNDRWKDKVADVAAVSQYVVLATGLTEGLRWEISYLVANVPPEKVILWAHPHLLRLGARQREEEWARFRAAFGDLFPKPLPETLGEARFLYFTADWQPHPVAPRRGLMPWLNADAAALRAVMDVKQGQATEAEVDYAGPDAEDSFASVIGVAEERVHWPRAAAFVGATVAMQIPFVISGGSVSPLVWALLISGAALVTFRYLPAFAAAVVAAIAPTLHYYLVSQEPSLEDLARAFVLNLAFLGGLAWTTRRMAPLVLALWVGAMCAPVARVLLLILGPGRAISLGSLNWFIQFLRPILFAVCLALAVRLTPTTRK